MTTIPPCGPASDAGPLSSDLTSVQPLATTHLLLLCQTACQQHLHSPFAAQREMIILALVNDPAHRFQSHCLRMCCCCAFPVIWIGPDGKPSVNLARCRIRLCPLCSKTRAFESGLRVHELLATMDCPRFMTLTVPHRRRDLRQQLDQVMSMFRELRKTDAWREYVQGGVWSLEVTYNPDTGDWHPHIHIIFDGTYFPQPELKAEWSRIIGEAAIADVRAVHSRRDAAHYVAKYISKALEMEEWPESKIREYASATFRRRTIHTFGSCHGVSTEADPTEDKPAPGQRTVGVWVLRRRIALGDQQARIHAGALASTGGRLAWLLRVEHQILPTYVGEELERRLIEAAQWLLSLDPLDAWKYAPPPPKPPPGPTFKDRTPPLVNIR